VAPHRLTLPEGLDERRALGVATQLYQLRSSGSWGIGDLDDLARLGIWASERHGADFVLVNPLHAAEPVPPMEPSPYLPTTRRFLNPLYLRVETSRRRRSSTRRTPRVWSGWPRAARRSTARTGSTATSRGT
jgi:4-alpha-glucanotransferase